MDTDGLDPRRRPLLTAGCLYIIAHIGTIAGVALWYSRDVGGLVASGATSLPYVLLITGFAVAITILSGRSLSRRWWIGGVAIVVGLAVLRSVLSTAGFLLTGVVLFAIVLLPVVVFVAVLLRALVVRLPSDRLASLPHRSETVRLLFVVGLFLVAIAGGSVAAVVTAPPAVPSADWEADRQLAYLERTDQTDRQTGAFVDSRRDYQRAERVLTLLAADRVDTPDGALSAAIVLHHGTCRAHFEIAHRLATAAATEGVEKAAPWTRLTYDRWQLSLGNSQEYGTQTGSPGVTEACAPPIPDGLNVSAPMGGAKMSPTDATTP